MSVARYFKITLVEYLNILAQYRSLLLRVIETITFSPLLMSGHVVERQTVYVEFFDDFADNPSYPAVKVDFQLQSRFAEIYNARSGQMHY